MRILCAIGTRRGSEVIRHVAPITREGDELVLVHVIDEGPRHDLDRLRGPLHPHHEHREELDAAEEEAGKAMLKEALAEAARLGLTASERLERGRPEHVVVELARETKRDVGRPVCPRIAPGAPAARAALGGPYGEICGRPFADACPPAAGERPVE